jgi:hypothetical protein
LGLTSLGLAGETLKGPAFEPVAISSKDEFKKIFGAQSMEKLGSKYKYLLPYYANSFLDEANQLFVTRVLGLTGYNAGKGWAITISSALDKTTTGTTTTTTNSGGTSFTGSTILGITIANIATGSTGTTSASYVKTTGTSFSASTTNFFVTAYNTATTVGTYSGVTTGLSGTSLSAYENMVVAVVRPRADVAIDNTLTFEASAVTITSNASSATTFGTFVINASGATSDSYQVSLLNTNKNFISKVLGDTPKGKSTLLYVESVYPDLISKLDSDGVIYGVNTTLVALSGTTFSNYNYQYQTPQTPYVVSELKGNRVDRLYRFVMISDGADANKEVKISHQNIDPATLEFDVIVRDFNDTDENIVVLESFPRCTLIRSADNFIGKKIGSIDGQFDRKSNYFLIDFFDLDNIGNDSFPCGFEGYFLRSYSASTSSTTAKTPKMLYKSSYLATDKVKRTYLGISERAYDLIGTKGTGINQNMFNFVGDVTTGYSKTNGFHFDSGATATYDIGTFQVGADAISAADVRIVTNKYNDKLSRKFTFAPYGGFDGWDENRTVRTNTKLYKSGGIYQLTSALSSDYYAYLNAVQTYQNPNDVYVNVFATPGINMIDNLEIVNDTIDMIENDRADAVYIIDLPDYENSVAMSQSIADDVDTSDIDSNYCCTYAPYIEINDKDNGAKIFLPPTGEVMRAIAITDKTKAPWWAVGGLNRGVTKATRARRKLSADDQKILYTGRVNPMVAFSEVGVAIFGQKTLQKAESALDRLNVRRSLLHIKKLISNVSARLLFDQDDAIIQDQFKLKVGPLLEQIKKDRGLFDYKIVMDTSNNTPESIDRKELYGTIFLKPINAVEFIGITMVLSPTGASFSE